jgi:Uma2 family endonuclease
MIAKLRTARPRRQFTADEFRRMVAAGVFGPDAPTYAAGDVYDAAGAPYLFAVEQYHRLIDAGLLGEDERVELIHGEIVDDMPIGDPHMACVKRLNRAFNRLYAARALVSIQDPIRLADSEPEPDAMLLALRADFYGSGKPRPADAYLVVEVADRSFADDRDTKGPLYAANGVAEYWIVNLNDDTVHVYRGPRPDGTYTSVEQFTHGATLTVAALPGVAVAVADLLP